ncbi:MAG: DUF2158 domain-containing protein [Pyrinomonadaceae bacterium]
MTSEQFKVGDVVRLKSGSPKMTVISAEERDHYFCQWFDSKGAIGQGEFPGAALQLIPNDSEFIGIA